MQQLHHRTFPEEDVLSRQDRAGLDGTENHTESIDETIWLQEHDTSKRTIDYGEVKIAAMHLLRLSENIGSYAIKKVIELIHTDTFKQDVVRQHIPNWSDCLAIVDDSVAETLLHDGFEKVEVPYKTATDDGRKAFLYRKDVIDVLRSQVKVANDTEVMFRPCFNEQNRDFVSHPLHSEFFAELYMSIRSHIMGSANSKIQWNQSRDSMPKSFIGMLQIYTDKTATTLKSQSLVGYPIHVTFLNVSVQLRRFLIDHGYTLVGFLPVGLQGAHSDRDENNFSFSDHDHSEDHIVIDDHVPLTSSSQGRDHKMISLHKAMDMVLAPLLQKSLQGFSLCTRNEMTWNCFPVIISYCCDIPESKDMSGVLHNFTPRRPCVRCLGTCKDFDGGVKASPRLVHNVTITRGDVSELLKSAATASSTARKNMLVKEAQLLLQDMSIAQWVPFLETASASHPHLFVPGTFSIFTYEPLHNLHLGTSKAIKTCFMTYLASPNLIIHCSDKKRHGKTFRSCRTALLRACNALLAAIENQFGAPGFHVDFSTKEKSQQLNGLFLNNTIRGMLEGKDFKCLDMVFPFVAAYIDRVTGYQDNAPLTDICTSYTTLMQDLLYDNTSTGWSRDMIADITHRISLLKSKCVHTFEKHCEHGIHTLKFHLLDHVVEDLSKFGGLNILDASPYEHFNTFFKQSYRSTSKRIATRMDETVTNMAPTICTLRQSSHHETFMKRGLNCINAEKSSGSETVPIHRPQPSTYLVREGVSVTLLQIDAMKKNYHVCNEATNLILTPILKNLSCTSLTVFTKLIRIYLQDNDIFLTDNEVGFTFLKSGYIIGGHLPTLKQYNHSTNTVKYSPPTQQFQIKQRIFATATFGPSKKKRHSFVLIKGGDADSPVYYIAKVLLLFRMNISNIMTNKEMAFVQYMEFTPPIDNVDDILNCLCLRWSTSDEIDYTQPGAENKPVHNILETGEWYDIIDFNTICSSVHVLRSNFGIDSFTQQLPWPRQRFYINRFYRERDAFKFGKSDYAEDDDPI